MEHNMNKHDYYQSALGMIDTLLALPSKEGLKLLESLYGTQYHLTESLQPGISELISIGLVETSTNKCSISILGQHLIETAAKLFGDENIESRHNGSIKREITEDMISIKDFAVEYIEGKVELKGTHEDRSNFLILFKKGIKGLGCIEIKNKPEIRVCIRKASKEAIELFSSIGMKYRETPAQTYFDMPKSHDNVKLLIDTIVTYIK
ncbi:MotA-like activator of middle period transcription [Acinetobacter phage Acj9]|uniref:MotA activator of middle period transcription n=1 Tax=Acinetobacter phage Acj9 TaxID=760939 RepID=E5EQ31_9CAUD|nr:MotA-like activator of middle period transcription [Acinetobacter phage Acj9]ADG60147.1 MotA activator of middle period transcription [Acinetobacter phage Acj9]